MGPVSQRGTLGEWIRAGTLERMELPIVHPLLIWAVYWAGVVATVWWDLRDSGDRWRTRLVTAATLGTGLSLGGGLIIYIICGSTGSEITGGNGEIGGGFS